MPYIHELQLSNLKAIFKWSEHIARISGKLPLTGELFVTLICFVTPRLNIGQDVS